MVLEPTPMKINPQRSLLAQGRPTPQVSHVVQADRTALWWLDVPTAPISAFPHCQMKWV